MTRRSRLIQGLFSALLVSFLMPLAAEAGEPGMVVNSGGQLRAEPKPKGKKIDKLKQGSMVDVSDHSPDGKWIKVSVKGSEALEGWVEKDYVRARSRYGFSWERRDVKDVKGVGAGKGAAASKEAASNDASKEKGAASEGTASEGTAVSAKEKPSSDAKLELTEQAPSGSGSEGAGWGQDSTDGDWGGGDAAATPAAAAATPAPADEPLEIVEEETPEAKPTPAAKPTPLNTDGDEEIVLE